MGNDAEIFESWARANLQPVHAACLDVIRDRIGHVPDIDRTLHPDDHMLLKNPVGYFGTGVAALASILLGIDAAGRPHDSIGTILDFGSGYGRIYRTLAAAFPASRLTALDLMGDGARFCAETLAAIGSPRMKTSGRSTFRGNTT